MFEKYQLILNGDNCCGGSVIESRVSQVDRSLCRVAMRHSLIEGPGHHASGTCSGQALTLASPGPLFRTRTTISEAPISRMSKSASTTPGTVGTPARGRTPEKYYRDAVYAYTNAATATTPDGRTPLQPVRAGVKGGGSSGSNNRWSANAPPPEAVPKYPKGARGNEEGTGTPEAIGPGLGGWVVARKGMNKNRRAGLPSGGGSPARQRNDETIPLQNNKTKTMWFR